MVWGRRLTEGAGRRLVCLQQRSRTREGARGPQAAPPPAMFLPLTLRLRMGMAQIEVNPPVQMPKSEWAQEAKGARETKRTGCGTDDEDVLQGGRVRMDDARLHALGQRRNRLHRHESSLSSKRRVAKEKGAKGRTSTELRTRSNGASGANLCRLAPSLVPKMDDAMAMPIVPPTVARKAGSVSWLSPLLKDAATHRAGQTRRVPSFAGPQSRPRSRPGRR